jgi:hypothetical protein
VVHKRLTAVVVGLSCVAVVATQSAEDQFRRLARTHRWFELRATATDRSSPLLRGAVAAAFKDPRSGLQTKEIRLEVRGAVSLFASLSTPAVICSDMARSTIFMRIQNEQDSPVPRHPEVKESLLNS